MYNPATGREEYVFIGTEQEVSIGRNAAGQFERRYKLSRDSGIQERVKAIGDRIAVVSDRREVPYYFRVIVDKEVNAVSLPGGYVYVNDGLIRKVGSDAELAGVLAHEVGHIAARHAVKALEANMTYSLISVLIFTQTRVSADMQRAANTVFNLVALGYGRDDELLADRLAVRYMHKAGYDPRALLTFMERLRKIQGSDPMSVSVIFRSHPYVSDRIRNIKQEIAIHGY
jgi:predicted Zn-dependent protease